MLKIGTSKIIAIILVIVLIAFMFFFFSTFDGITGNTIAVTFLVDSDCENCYDIEMHRQILEKYDIRVKDRVVDVNSEEGIELIDEYNIESIPAYIMDSDAAENIELMEIWPEIGTVEENGELVFRNNYILSSTYKELVNGRWAMVYS